MMVGECRQNATAHMGPAVGQASVSSPHVSSFRAAYAPTEETNTPHGDAASLQQEHFLPLVGQPQPVQPHFLSVNPMVVDDLFPFSSHGGVTYNLNPHLLQSPTTSASIHGIPKFPSDWIPTPIINVPTPLTVQDRPLVPPVYNGVNPHYPGLRLMNVNPPVFAVENFLTPFECSFLAEAANDAFGPAPVVGKGVGEVSPSRTSSTCYLAREDLPDYMRKVTLLTGKPVEHCELPQVGRYFPSQQYLQHFDAFDLSNEDGRRFASNGGQRTVTVLVYLNDVYQGGATSFPALGLQVQPRQGTAVVFFPATVDGLLDKMALHAALPAIDTKYVSQVWIRQGEYVGHPSKRLAQTMGVPFGQEFNLMPGLMNVC